MKYLDAILWAVILSILTRSVTPKTHTHSNVITDVKDIKEFKKVIRMKTNVLVGFFNSLKQQQAVVKVFKDTADAVKGEGTMILIECSNDAKKLCKKLKVDPESYLLKHYKDGEFNKDYDRKLTVTSMVNFMRDPTGDIPWEEDTTASKVVHIPDPQSLKSLIRKENRPLMVMFYAPWCGFCKQLKPDYALAADELGSAGVFAAIDVNRPKNSVVRTQYNITGFPTLLYFEKSKLKMTYEGDNKKDALVKFMRNPKEFKAEKPAPEPQWSETSPPEIQHLTVEDFDATLSTHKSVLVMFYAPWCGHCKKMKPEYEKAAVQMKIDQIAGLLAALDATQHAEIATRFKVTGYPTVKYFANGEFKFDVPTVRTADKLVEFMRDPKPPAVDADSVERVWSDEPSDVVHLTVDSFKMFLKKKKHVLVMFYAPWCGHCKKAKPEFTKAAEHFKDNPKVEFAAIDCTKHSSVCSAYDVKGYPTLKYFNYLKNIKAYTDERDAKHFIAFMENGGSSPPEKDPWGTHPGSDHVIHLMDDTFDVTLKQKPLVFVMFYAPWCGHCTKMKPEYSLLAKSLHDANIDGVGAMDCTKNSVVPKRIGIEGFPTVKLFKYGVDVGTYDGERTSTRMKEYFFKHLRDRDEL